MADLTTTTPDRSQDRSRKRETVTARGIGFVVLLSVVAEPSEKQTFTFVPEDEH